MSATEDKDLSKPREDSGKARRTFASLKDCRGFSGRIPEFGLDAVPKVVAELVLSRECVVSIAAMDVRSYWRHVGNGKWTAAEAQYEKVET